MTAFTKQHLSNIQIGYNPIEIYLFIDKVGENWSCFSVAEYYSCEPLYNSTEHWNTLEFIIVKIRKNIHKTPSYFSENQI